MKSENTFLKNDLLDCIVMLPDQLFYNTGIYTYIWLLNNNKPKDRKEKVLLINAREQFSDEPKSLGEKRHRLEKQHRDWIKQKHEAWKADEHCSIFHYDFVSTKFKLCFIKPMKKNNQWTSQKNLQRK